MGLLVGRFLKEKREKAKLSQGKLAIALGLKSAQYISNIERGIAPLPKTMLVSMGRILKVRPMQFVSVIMEEIYEKYKEATEESA